MERSKSSRSNSFSSSGEGSKGDCAEHSTSHNSRRLVWRSRGAGRENSCAGDGGDHVGSCTGHRRRKYSLSPSSVPGNSKYSKARYVNNHSSKRSDHHVVELQHRRTHARYQEQDELALRARSLRSFSEPRLRFSPSSSSSSTSLQRQFQRSVTAHNHSFLAAQDCGDDQDFLKSSCNQHNHSDLSRFWRDFDAVDHDFSSKRSCNESGLGFCDALFDMFLALVLSLCGEKTICLRALWNSTAGGGGGGGNGKVSSAGKEERGLGRMQLVTVSMLGSMDWVRVVVRGDASVRATIQAVLKAFASQQRMPPNGSDPGAYHLHYSAFSIQCLDSDELVENLGARSFVLCPGPFITPQDRSLSSTVVPEG